MGGAATLIHPGARGHPSTMTPTPSFPEGWRPQVRDDVVFRRVAEDWVLFDPASQQIHVLNLTAALVWSFCTGDADVAAIEGQVKEAFGIANQDPQVVEALQGFLDAGLLASP